MDKKIESRFWGRVEKTASCWLWSGTLVKGYGQMWVGRPRRWAYAHRVSWELHAGQIPPGLFVCHRCDTPRCVRPDHLFVGSPKANSDDMMSKGRFRPHVGERNPIARLTERSVIEIRSLRAEGATLSELARRFGVATSTIGNAANGARWAHVRGES